VARMREAGKRREGGAVVVPLMQSRTPCPPDDGKDDADRIDQRGPSLWPLRRVRCQNRVRNLRELCRPLPHRWGARRMLAGA
jgi:hypothetical protein